MRSIQRTHILFFLGFGLIAGAPGSASPFGPGDVVLLGELHGTEQSPAFVEALVQELVDHGRQVVVGLEIPSPLQASADEFAGSPGGEEDRAALLASRFWTRDYQDGRGSRAMADLLEAIRRLRESGGPVRPLFFDAGTAPGQSRDARMAAAIAESVRANPEVIHVILTGNLHSRIARGGRPGGDFRPMGFYLMEEFTDRVTALNVAHDGGTAWLCAPDCGIVNLRESHPGGRQGSIEIDEANRPAGHHGWYHVGTLSASVPAVGDHEAPIESPVPAEPGPADAKDRKTEPVDSEEVRRWQGRWQAYQNGVKSWTLDIDGLSFYAEVSPEDWYRGKLFIRPADDLSQIDFLIEECQCGYKGESSDAIYRWDDDTITVGTPMPNTRRPTFFNEQKGEVVTLRRVETAASR